MDKAVKFDFGKTRYDLLPLEALEETGKVLSYGAAKYVPNNWRKGFAYSRLTSAALRHLFAWMRGEKLDPESGLHHLAHCTSNIMFLLEIELTGCGIDDRVITKAQE